MLVDENGDYHRFIIGREDMADEEWGREFEAVTVFFMEVGRDYLEFNSSSYYVEDHVEDYAEEVVIDGVQSTLGGLGRRQTGRCSKGEG